MNRPITAESVPVFPCWIHRPTTGWEWSNNNWWCHHRGTVGEMIHEGFTSWAIGDVQLELDFL